MTGIRSYRQEPLTMTEFISIMRDPGHLRVVLVVPRASNPLWEHLKYMSPFRDIPIFWWSSAEHWIAPTYLSHRLYLGKHNIRARYQWWHPPASHHPFHVMFVGCWLTRDLSTGARFHVQILLPLFWDVLSTLRFSFSCQTTLNLPMVPVPELAVTSCRLTHMPKISWHRMTPTE